MFVFSRLEYIERKLKSLGGEDWWKGYRSSRVANLEDQVRDLTLKLSDLGERYETLRAYLGLELFSVEATPKHYIMEKKRKK